MITQSHWPYTTFWYTRLFLEGRHMGQLENAEMQKPKYRNGSMDMRKRVTYHPQLCVLRPCSQTVMYWLPAKWEPDPGSSDGSKCCYHNATVSLSVQTEPMTTASGPTMLALCSWCSHTWQWYRCECCHSFSLRLFQWLNSHHTLNDCVSVCWNPNSPVLSSHTWRQSPFGYKAQSWSSIRY